MACVAEPIAAEARCIGQRAMHASYLPSRSRRALFAGSNGGSDGAENAVDGENECAQASAFDGDDGSEYDPSESDFEPSEGSESDSSASEDEVCERPQVGLKRKRGTSNMEPTRAAPRISRLSDDASVAPQDAHTHEARLHAFVCDIEGCGRSFADEALAIQHFHAWHDVRDSERLVCATCDTFFLTLHDLHLHAQQSAHTLEDPPRRLFVCGAVETCRQAYKKKDKLAPHRRRYHERSEDGSLFECNRCEMGFATRHERQLHSEKVHPGRTSSPPSPSFVCEFEGCGKAYSKREHLTRHVRTTHEAPPEKPFGCDLCGVRFVYKHALARHHTNCHTTDVDKPYACAICLLTFKKKSLLQAHSFVHTGVLPFECEDCDERFLKKFQLTRHARKHASGKPSQTQVFMCDHDDCGELLFSLQEKDEHLRDAHGVDTKQEEEKKRVTGRELRCLVCNHTSSRIQNLRSHLRTHFEALDERKLHACPMEACDKAYTKKSNLMAHYNAVHDPVKSRRFQCPYARCDGAFGYKKVLQTHIASIHEKTSVVKNEEGDTHCDSGSEEEGEEEEEKEETKGKMHLKNQKKMRKKRKGRKSAGVLTRVLGLDDRSTTSTPK